MSALGNPRKSIALAVALLALSACQTTGSNGVYQAAFDQGGKSPASDAAAPVPGETIDNFHLADLKPGERPDLTTEEAGLWMMMDRAERGLATSGSRITDPALTAYVEDIVCRVAGQYCKDFRVYIMRAPMFNASMAPNGTMIVYTGLLLRARNEAQLASVIGHEISHYLRRHSVQRMKDAVDKSSALLFVRMATAVAGVGAIGDLAALGTLGSIQAFSRDHEREADGYGLALLVRAGYDPSEAAIIWQRVIRERDAALEKRGSDGFMATHPPSEERNDALNKLALSVSNGAELRTGEAAFQAAIRPFRSDFFRDELAKRQYSTTLAVYDMLLEDGYRPAEVHYFKGELYRLRGADGDRELALSAYRKATAEDGAPVDVYRSQGLLLKRAGRVEEAHAAFRTYLDRAPDAPDHEMIQAMLEGNL